MTFLKNLKFLFLCTVIAATDEFEEEIHLPADGLRSLSELPMTKLIQIKLSLAQDVALDDENVEEDVEGRGALALPMASPYKGIDNRSVRRHGEWEDKGKDTKISKIFQLTITSLSFLAFGGYLMTLIITAIRRNAMAANPGNVIVFSNLQSLTKYKRPKRNTVMMDTILNDSATDQFYQGMIMLSEGYVMYTKMK